MRTHQNVVLDGQIRRTIGDQELHSLELDASGRRTNILLTHVAGHYTRRRTENGGVGAFRLCVCLMGSCVCVCFGLCAVGFLCVLLFTRLSTRFRLVFSLRFCKLTRSLKIKQLQNNSETKTRRVTRNICIYV